MSNNGWVLSSLLVIGVATAQSGAAETVQKPAKVTTSVIQTGAIVEAVNKETRELKLIGPDNRRFTVVADERVRNFDQIKPRDRIRLEYYESVAIVVAPPGQTDTDAAAISGVEVAGLGDKPGLGMVDARGMRATIAALDRGRRIATLTLPNGETRTVKASDEARLDLVDVGDTVTVVLTEAMAVSVVPPPE